jgi:hypothetical protein
VLVDARHAGVASDSLQRALRSARLRIGSGAAVGAAGWLPIALTSPSEVLEEAASRLGSVLAEAKGGTTDG